MEEEEVETTQPEEQDFNIPDIERSRYSKEDLINAKELRTVDFKQDLLKEIDGAKLYQEAKRALRILVNESLSQGWLLANLEKSNTRDENRGARISFQLNYLAAKASFCKSDVNSPDMNNIINALERHFNTPVLSRAVGKSRERMINNTSTIDYTVTNRQERQVTERESAARKTKNSLWRK